MDQPMEPASVDVVQQVLTVRDEDRPQVVAQGIQALPAEAKQEVVAQSLRALPDKVKREVAREAGLAPPSRVTSNIIWILLVASFCAVLVGGGWLLYVMSRDDIDTTVITPIITTVLGALVGLLAPSPIVQDGGSREE